MATQNATRQILSRSFLQQAQDWQRRVGPLASSRGLIASGAYSHVLLSVWHRQILHINGKLSHLLSHLSHGSSRCDKRCGLQRCVEQVGNTVRLAHTPEAVSRNDSAVPLEAATRRVELSQCRDPDGLVDIRASFGRGIGDKQRPLAREGLCNGYQAAGGCMR